MMKSRRGLLVTLLLLIGLTWLVVTLILYTVSALITGDSLVFLMGGSRNAIIMFVMNALALAVAWISPLLFWKRNMIKSVKGRTSIYILLQTVIIFIMLVGFYLLANRFILGITPVGLDIQMTADFRNSMIIKVVIFIIAIVFGSLSGLAFLFPPNFRGSEFEMIRPEDIEMRNRNL